MRKYKCCVEWEVPNNERHWQYCPICRKRKAPVKIPEIDTPDNTSYQSYTNKESDGE